METAVDRLRTATREIHAQLETLPYPRALLSGALPLDRYASFLRAMHAIELGLEQAVELSASSVLRATFGQSVERRARLQRDLAHLGIDPHGVDAAALCALVLNQRMRLAALREPELLLGYLYVIEGSQLGGLVQRAALSARPELAEGGLAYLTGYGKGAQAAFDSFTKRLEEALLSEPARLLAERGAREAFMGFEALLGTLDPDARPYDAGAQVGELNPDAGTHALPDDLREVEAALRAGEHTFRAFAYYDARYGERGLRFTRSDSAWLATLAREGAPLAQHHVLWLARVLAARGMPRLLMEQHLEVLHDELAKSVAERSAQYRALLVCAEALRRERLAAFPDEHARAAVEAFCRGAQSEHGITPAEAASLLTAAVADERCEVPSAVASLMSWLADPARFSPTWIAAVQRLLSSVRQPA